MPTTSLDDAAERHDLSPWSDLETYISTPRLQDLVLSPDGETLLVSVSGLDAERTGYVTAWWRVDPSGQAPARRYTRSTEGESAAAFTRDGSLLFTSARPTPPSPQQPERPDPSGSPDTPAGSDHPDRTDQTDRTETDAKVLWCLPGGGGEAYPLARRDGGWQGVATARDADVAVLSAGYHVGAATEAEDRAKRALRKKRKIAAILHEGYPVRFWDHDLNAIDTRLFAVDLTDQHNVEGTAAGDLAPDADAFTELTPGTVRGISSVDAVAADGSFAVIGQQLAGRRGTSS